MQQRTMYDRRSHFLQHRIAIGVCALAASLGQAQTPPLDRYLAVRGRQPTASLGRYEGERDFELVGNSRVQSLAHYGDQWSGDAHLLWDGVIGETMESSFVVASAGIYDIDLQLTVAGDYGSFEFFLDGTDIRESVDLYGPKVDLAPPIKLRDVRLPAGRQTIKFKLVGSNSKARQFKGAGYLMGLDYLQLTRKDKRFNNAAREPTANRGPDFGPSTVTAVQPMPPDEFAVTLEKSCYRCHSGVEIEAEVDLRRFTERASMLENIDTTRRIRDALARNEMPPPRESQPSDSVRRRLVATLDAVIDEYLKQHRSADPVVMRRLNRYEYNNAVRDLLQLRGDIYPLPEKTIRASEPYFDPGQGRLPEAIVVGNRTLGKNQVEKQILTGVSPFAIDLQAEGGFNNRGSELGTSPILLESFLKLGRSIVSSPEFDDYCGLTDSFFKAPSGEKSAQPAIARERLATFLEKAFRSHVEPALLERYYQFFLRQLEETDSFRRSMKNVVAAALASPRFIYVSESSAGESESLLGGYELATRLSLFLWSSIPDEPLLAAARNGSLTEPDVLDAQVTRMLTDPRCQSLSENFARQWLRLDQMVTAVPDFDRFPEYYSRIGCEQWKFGLQMMIEPLLLFESIVVEDRSIMLLVDCNYSYRSDELQSWYDEPEFLMRRENRGRFNTHQQRFQKRAIVDRRQGGVITSAAALTMTSSPLRTSPIARGAWVATVIFNRPPPPPPDVVPAIEADDKAIEEKGMTLRERLEQHQVNASCVACHSKIDPLGFVLENYDAVGRWRERYRSGLQIDASGEILGTIQFSNIVELKDALLENPDLFMRAFAEHMLSYALGRRLELTDTPAVDHIVAHVAADQGRFTTVVREIVRSHPFRYRARQLESRGSQ